MTVGGRTVITVTRVRASGGGKARSVESTPVGFIEVDRRRVRLSPRSTTARAARIRTAAAAATTVVGRSRAHERFAHRAAPVPRLLPPGRR